MKKYLIIVSILLLAVSCMKKQPEVVIDYGSEGKIESISIEPSYLNAGWKMYTDGAVVKVVAKNLQNVEIKYIPTGTGMSEVSLGEATSLSSQQYTWALPLPKEIMATNFWAESKDSSGKIIKSQDLGNVGYENPTENLVYNNTNYGFYFTLPQSWEGYKAFVKAKGWEGYKMVEPQGAVVIEQGPEVIIRHPSWTEKKPYQDIPVFVFTLKQWDDMGTDKFHIGAAPINPGELGRNNQYVFALPARYNFADAFGIAEVDQIIQTHPLRAYNVDSGQTKQVTLTGTTVCLPHKNVLPDQPQTMECAIGLKDDQSGKYYALGGTIVKSYDMNTRVAITGTLRKDFMTESMAIKYDIVGIIDVTSLAGLVK